MMHSPGFPLNNYNELLKFSGQEKFSAALFEMMHFPSFPLNNYYEQLFPEYTRLSVHFFQTLVSGVEQFQIVP